MNSINITAHPNGDGEYNKSEEHIFPKHKLRVWGFLILFLIREVAVICIFIFAGSVTSCKKLVEVDAPETSLSSGNVYSTDAAAASVLTGLYASISKNGVGLSNIQPRINGISLHLALSADELSLNGRSANGNSDLINFYANSLTNQQKKTFWEDLYSNIYVVNLAEERLNASISLTQSIRQQLIGETKFMRAFFYFNLVNLYGEVPLTTRSDYRANAVLFRASNSQVWQQIINDLKDAQSLLTDSYVGSDAKTPSPERVRPNKWVATALLARAYLYTQKWDSAEVQATSILNNSGMFSLDTLNGSFLKASLGNKEAIWQMQPVNTGWNTEDARVFILPSTGPTTTSGGYPVYLDSNLVNSFEVGDLRKTNWIKSVTPTPPGNATYYFPYKYKNATLNNPVTEYTMVLRLGEQYLIRAEARTEQNNISGAQADLDSIRNRAGLSITIANNKNSLLIAILQERRHELFTEWGHRWFDLKRTGNVDTAMTTACSLKGGIWSTNWQWYPLPIYDLQQNPNLIQNSGY